MSGRSATNGEIVALLQGHFKLMDERHADNRVRLDALLSKTEELAEKVGIQNGRVTRLESAVEALKGEREQKPRTVLKVGSGTGIGIVLTKLLEWIQK